MDRKNIPAYLIIALMIILMVQPSLGTKNFAEIASIGIISYPEKNNNNLTELNSKSVWGVNVGGSRPYDILPFWTQPETRETLKDGGVGVVRIWASKFETWQNIEYVVDTTIASGMIPILVVSDGSLERSTDIAKRLGDREVIFQIGNEPNYGDQYSHAKEYAEAYKTVSNEIKKIKPNSKFMTAGIGIWGDLSNLDYSKECGLDYFTETLAIGAQVDYVAFHYYATYEDPTATKELALERAENYAKIVQKLKDITGKPVACTEWSWGSWDSPRWDLDDEFINNFMDIAMNGLKECAYSTYWFSQMWEDHPATDTHPLVMLNADGTPKTVYYAFQRNEKLL
jgi:alpha-glucosidase (family GH31 glycosyl hydrolase)